MQDPAARRRIAPFVALGISMLLTLMATAAVSVVAQQRETSRFQSRVRSAEARVEARLDAYTDILRTTDALVEVGEAEPGRFERWVEALDLPRHHPGIRALGHLVVDGPDLRVLRVAPGEPDAILAPATAEALRRTLYRVQDGEEPTLSPRLALADGTSAFFLLLPTGGGDDAASGASGSYVFATLLAAQLFTGLQPGDTRIALRIFDGRRLDEDRLLLGSADLAGHRPRHVARRELDAAGQKWTLEVATLPVFEGESGRALVVLLALMGLLTSGLVYRLTRIEAAARSHAERAADELRDALRERQRAEFDREQLIAALERNNEELEEVAAVASHDLKAPLRGIATLSRLLERELDGVLTSDSRRHMGMLRERVLRMADLVDAILRYARAGRERIPTEDVEVAELVAQTVELLDPPPDLVVELPAELPTLHAPRLPLQQVFLNLLANALKYGRPAEGTPRVEVSGRVEGEWVEFTVRDNGEGVPLELRDRVFTMFRTARSDGGTGIGLALVKKHVESRGGRVVLECPPEGGTCFRFTWPLRVRRVGPSVSLAPGPPPEGPLGRSLAG